MVHFVGTERGTLGAVSSLVLLACALACGRDITEPSPWGLSEERRAVSSQPLDNEDPSRDGTWWLELPVGGDRSNFALVGTEGVSVGTGAEVSCGGGRPDPLSCAIGAFTDARIGSNARTGPVYFSGKFVAGAGAHIQGFIAGDAEPGLDPTTVLDGQVLHRPSTVELRTWHVERPIAGPGRTIESTDSQRVAPGSYASLVVLPDSTAVLSHGSYFLGALDVHADATLELDSSQGPIYIWVYDKLTLRGGLRDAFFGGVALFVGYGGTESPIIETSFRGLLLAPRATLHLPATSPPHIGSFFARRVELAPKAKVEQRPFNPAPVAGSPPCAVCAAAARAVAAQCCSSTSFTVSVGEEMDAECLGSCAAPLAPRDSDCFRACELERARRASRSTNDATLCAFEVAQTFSLCQMSHGFRPGSCTSPHLDYGLSECLQ